MKNKSFFSQIILLVIVAVICIISTVLVALLVGSADIELFDFSNLNISNMLPVLFIGAFITCAIVGVMFLFLAKTAFSKAKEFFDDENTKNDGRNEK